MKKRIIPSVSKKEREKLNEGVDTPDLDCGIYLPDKDKDYFLPINNTKMPEKPDYQKIHNAIYPAGSKSRYSRIIPNSHFWTDLNQILQTIKYALKREKHETEKVSNVIYVGEPITSEYFIIGLKNSIEHDYKLKQGEKPDNDEYLYKSFESIDEMIEYAGSRIFTMENFYNLINGTIKNGLNLTNGLKMERENVYKRIDVERKYQDLVGKSGQRGDTPDEEKPVAEWLNYIEFHLNKAKDYNYHLRKDHSLEELRKVAALTVRAMEIHGCPERRMPERIGNITINSDGTIAYRTDNCDSK